MNIRTEDYEIKLESSINGYTSIYRRLFYFDGYCKRIVIALTPEERELASEAVKVKAELEKLKSSWIYKAIKFFNP